MQLGGRSIAEGAPCFVIAEAGSNHNGDLELAYRLIDVAALARADAVKFQLFRASKLYPRSAGEAGYMAGTQKSIFDVIAELEVPDAWIPLLAERCQQRGIQFMCTPFDEESADLIAPYVPAFKIASYEMTHLPLVRHCAAKGKPLIVSTGTSELSEVLETVAAVRSTGNNDLILLQCTASYPAPIETANVRALQTLRQATGLPTGLSDHTSDPLIAPILAVALGACLIEKHFTLDRSLPGPDHQYAIEPGELRDMIRCVRAAEAGLGHGRKEVLPVEQELRDFARRSIFAARPIAAGERFTRDNVVVLRQGRHGKGLQPSAFDALLGKTALRAVPADVPIQAEDVG